MPEHDSMPVLTWEPEFIPVAPDEDDANPYLLAAAVMAEANYSYENYYEETDDESH